MIDGLPEARVLEMFLEKYYASAAMTKNGLKILIEDKSTNCGANAIETKKVLKAAGVHNPQSMIIVQDPTMSLRTLASFEKAYEGTAVEMTTCPTFIPHVTLQEDELVWDVPGLKGNNLWEMDRFLDLIMGEIPRLRDDKSGYGPKGSGFISHVNLPDTVNGAYSSLHRLYRHRR